MIINGEVMRIIRDQDHHLNKIIKLIMISKVVLVSTK